MQVFLLVQAFDRVGSDASNKWMELGHVVYFPWLVGLSLMLTTGQSPADPENPLRLRPVSTQRITLARITVLFLGILFPALVCYLIFSAWVSLEFASFLVSAQLVFVRLLPLALFAAALGNRRKTLADACFWFLIWVGVGLLVFGLANLVSLTLHVQDPDWASFWWTTGITTLISALLLYDWHQVDLVKTTETSDRRKLFALFLLSFFVLALNFKADPFDYGHPPYRPEVLTENLLVRITPRHQYYVVRREDRGTSTYTDSLPRKGGEPGENWYFQGDIEIQGLPTGIGVSARVMDSEWISSDGDVITAAFDDQDIKERIFSSRMSSPRVPESHLKRLLSDQHVSDQTVSQVTRSVLFATDMETYEKFGRQKGQLRAVIRLDLYRFELIQRFGFPEGPETHRLQGGKRIRSYNTNFDKEDEFSYELELLGQKQSIRQPIGSQWSNYLRILAVDTRTDRILHQARGMEGSDGTIIPGFGNRLEEQVFNVRNISSNIDDPQPDPAHTEIVFITPVYEGSLHVEVTVDDVRLLPENHEGERR
ncbi:MAG: hypothetical protein JJU29_16100 [Verrucomicrobia bacterium]|nr:hypothetical protein [Verrucomicrobiota bacterium]MCH8510240.1 hypothetical protein [Kiritimatiellia bacterium]